MNWTKKQIAMETIRIEKKAKEDNEKWLEALDNLKIEVITNEQARKSKRN